MPLCYSIVRCCCLCSLFPGDRTWRFQTRVVDVSKAHEALAGHHGFRGAVFTEARRLGLRGYIQLFFVGTAAIPGLPAPRTFELVLEGPEQAMTSFREWLDSMKVCLATHPWFPPGFAVVPAFPISAA